MEIFILGITFISLSTLFIGFFAPGMPPGQMSNRSILSKHTRKMLRKRAWHDEVHKGFVRMDA